MSRLSMRSWDTAGAADGYVPSYDASTGQYMPKPPAGGTSLRLLAFKRTGTLAVGTGATRFYNDTGKAWTITSVRATVETAPSGGTVVADVNIDGTTIFTTQANRPTIAAAATTSGKVTNMDVTNVPDGSYLTVDIDTATAPSANLTVQIGILA